MGYHNDGAYDNGTWNRNYNYTPNASIHYNCTTLTDCRSNIDNKVQLCKGRFILLGQFCENFEIHGL